MSKTSVKSRYVSMKNHKEKCEEKRGKKIFLKCMFSDIRANKIRMIVSYKKKKETMKMKPLYCDCKAEKDKFRDCEE